MITLTKPVFETLIKHLIYIEESSDSLADFYFPDSPKEQEEIKDFFRVYIKKIENEMEHAKVVSIFTKVPCLDMLNTFPFVIIGSEVGLETASCKTAYNCRVIHTDSQTNVKNGITFLSPIGRSLLLRNAGSEIDIGIGNNIGSNINSSLCASAEMQRVKIKTIKLLA